MEGAYGFGVLLVEKGISYGLEAAEQTFFESLGFWRAFDSRRSMENAADYADFLREGGYEVVGPVAKVAAAIKHLANSIVDAALLDSRLHEEGSVEVADALLSMAILLAFLVVCQKKIFFFAS